MIPMLDLKRELADIGDEISKAVDKSIGETKFILGPNVKEFEKNAADYLGCKYTAGVASGTDALHLALKASGIKENDEVITTPFTFIATAEAIVYCGAKPVFVDIEPETMNINPELLEKSITEKTKAIIPVHLFGNPCRMDEIKQIADKYNLTVIEDCAQSFGATYNNKQTGTLGDIGCFSFFPSKNLGCYGDGGLISTNDENIYNDIMALRNHGSYEKYYHDRIGFNSRLDDIQAAILNVKIKYIDKANEDRILAAEKYKDIIQDSVSYQKVENKSKHVYHQFTIRSEKRNQIMSELQKHEIASAIYYPVPLHLQKSFASLNHKEGDLPVSEKLAQEVLSLPVNPYLEDEEITIISEIVKLASGK
ncbi:Glutamine--scyllo-inositol transaminase [Flexistipes sinusarabici DSM 4947]|uniref:Glutamine--scyllo-inositol transaminase n=1 Tax=Flexistipes sinusarabici (strain ATCC 49648 / DSM 4947 / MAS 10) TaxID=717231 RepID=F8E553_FLESM|nr:DegT/DnrJ/EryC1/StrS family aminotransferase [Flexistipes sinusarabici]AEI15689.1 Glutamine--scyllo-inositol transaminase [Flexistipes sinusarabici DSM 4947]